MVSVSACAQNPKNIRAAYVSPENYKGFSCAQLSQEDQRVQQALQSASASQKMARNKDTAALIVLGEPVTTSSGENIADQVANLKGQVVAVDQAKVANSCS
jgi:precorrin-2 methylase